MKTFLLVAVFLHFAFAQNAKLEIKETEKLTKVRKFVHYDLIVTNKESFEVKDVSVQYYLPEEVFFEKEVVKNKVISWSISKLLPKEQKRRKYKLKFLKPGVYKSFADLQINKELICQSKVLDTLVVDKNEKIKLIIKRQPHFQRISRGYYNISISNNFDIPISNFFLEGTISPLLKIRHINEEKPYFVRDKFLYHLGDIKKGESKNVTLFFETIKSGVCRSDFRAFNEDFSIERFDETTIVPSFRIPILFYGLDYNIDVGNNNEYFIELYNDFVPFLSNVQLTCKIPPNLKFISAKGITSFRQKGNLIIFDSTPLLFESRRLTYSITCKAIKKGEAVLGAYFSLQHNKFSFPAVRENVTIIK